MHDVWSFIVLGLVEGVTEFLPVSSSGHLILARDLFHISTDHGLAVDAVLQLATVAAVVVYFFKDLLKLDRKTIIALIIGTVPAIIFGLLLESKMETIFRNAHLVAYALIVGSVVMFAAERYSKHLETHTDSPSLLRGLAVGLFQCLALVPGMSRSGMTISGGLFMGYTRAEAARFGFLLSIPIILGSGLKKLHDLGADGTLSALGGDLVVGGVVAFLSGLAAIYILMQYVRTRPLTLFIVYRIAMAASILIFL